MSVDTFSARAAIDENHYAVPLIIGTGLASTTETIQLTKKVAEAGADCALVIPSGYYASLMSREALKRFFLDVGSASPIPVMIYNFPGAAGGVDMDSDLLEELAAEGDNFCGAKLTWVDRSPPLTRTELYSDARPLAKSQGSLGSLRVPTSGPRTLGHGSLPRARLRLWCSGGESNSSIAMAS